MTDPLFPDPPLKSRWCLGFVRPSTAAAAPRRTAAPAAHRSRPYTGVSRVSAHAGGSLNALRAVAEHVAQAGRWAAWVTASPETRGRPCALPAPQRPRRAVTGTTGAYKAPGARSGPLLRPAARGAPRRALAPPSREAAAQPLRHKLLHLDSCSPEPVSAGRQSEGGWLLCNGHGRRRGLLKHPRTAPVAQRLPSSCQVHRLAARAAAASRCPPSCRPPP